MAKKKSFLFEAPSDEDIEDTVPINKIKQSPWDFSSYSEPVADKHCTTSIDEKISKARQQLPIDVAEDDDNRHTEPHHQEEEEEDDDDELPTTSVNKPFFSKVEENVSFYADSFFNLHLSRPLLRASEALGYTKPTPIQAACIPLALNGRDICGSALTGSGKTAAFVLPTLERLLYRPKSRPAIRVLILTPTRELAVQVHSMIGKLAQFIADIRCCLVIGGLSMKVQEAALRTLPDIVVATPGRMIDHLRNSMSVHLDELEVLILDEADRLLELGFDAEIQELVKLCPKKRQTMLFSATMTEQVDKLIKLSLNKPLRLSADPSTKRPTTLTEEVVRIRRICEGNDEAVLLSLCSSTFTSKVIVFSGTKKAAHRLKIIFGLVGFKAAEFHKNLTQAQRLNALELFRKQEVDFLIATDIAARGLDIIGVQTVINFSFPRDITSYVHRVGRTARAGRAGYAVTLVTDNERSLMNSIAKKTGSKMGSRVVSEQSITKWSQIIEHLEEQVSLIIQEEMEEMALRKAEMEATKVENMIAHRYEILARPKKTWFVTEREKKINAQAAKEAMVKSKGSGKEVMSAEQAEELKMKKKREREREKNLPRKKRRKLEAAREMLVDEDEEVRGGEKNMKEKNRIALVDVAYRRAKAVKAASRAVKSGKIVKKSLVKKQPKSSSGQTTTKSRPEKMQELFRDDMSEKRQKRTVVRSGGMKKSLFKSKARYKRK